MKPPLASETRARDQRIVHIQCVVADFFGIPRGQMTAPERGVRVFSWPRQVAMYFATQLTPYSSGPIGRQFGGRDHGTVLYARDTVRDIMQAYPDIRAELSILRETLIRDAVASTPDSALRTPQSALP